MTSIPEDRLDQLETGAEAPTTTRPEEEELEDLGDTDGGQGHDAGDTGGTSSGDASPTDAQKNVSNPEAAAKASRGKQIIKGLRGKKALLYGALGASSIMFFIIASLFVAASLKIPHFMENVTTWQFSRVMRVASKTTLSLTSQKIAIDAADQSTYEKVKARYTTANGKAAERWAKLDKYRPNKLLRNYQADGRFRVEYTGSGILGSPRAVGVTLDNTRSVLLNQPTGIKGFIPGYSFRGDIQLAQEVQESLSKSLHASDANRLVRSSVGKRVRQELGIGWVAWKVADYKGKDKRTAAIKNIQDSYKITDGGVDPRNPNITADKINDAAEAVNEAEQKIVDDPERLSQVAAGSVDEIPEEITQALEGSLNESRFATIANTVGGGADVALPLCIIYDGSIIRAGPVIDEQTKREQRRYLNFATKDAQLREGGDNVTAEAIGAEVDRMGNIQESAAIKRAGGRSVNTESYASTQSSTLGSFSMADLLPGPAGSLVESTADTACPILLNPWANAALGIASIASAFFTGGSSAFAGQGAKQIAKEVTGRIVDRIFTKKFMTRTAVEAGVVSGATLMARYMVMKQAGTLNSSLSNGTQHLDQIDSGANQVAADVCRKDFACRPLSKAEASASDGKTLADINKSNGEKPFTERYFALSNPHSLLSRATFATAGSVGGNSMSLSAMHMPDIKPSSFFGNIVQTFAPKAFAQTSSAQSDFGNVPMGWSLEEEALLENDDTYASTPENQKILDDSGMEDKIVAKYGDCFGKTMGELLSSEKIMRDKDGNVIEDQGLCSPQNLGPNNKDSSSPCGNNGCGDLVFRFRVSKAYDTSNNVVIEHQDLSANDGAAAATTNQDLEANKARFTGILTLPSGAVGPPAIAFYHQSDPRWGGLPYPYNSGGSNTISASACGPSSLAMVISTLSGQIKNPEDLAEQAVPWHVTGGTDMNGAAPGILPEYGLKQEKIGVDKVKATLEAGGFVILSANGASPFTQAGHFVVIRAVSQDGKSFYVADPADNNGNGPDRSLKEWPMSSLSGWISAGMWAVTK